MTASTQPQPQSLLDRLVEEQERVNLDAVAVATERRNALRAQVATLSRAVVDAITPSDAIRAMAIPPELRESVPATDRVVLHAMEPDVRIRMLDGAHRQMAEKRDIPWKYYERMLHSEPQLLAANLNTWFKSEPDESLLRMLKPITEQDDVALTTLGAEFSARAVLSNRYRPIDHHEILNVVLPELESQGAMIRSFALTETRLYVEFYTQEVEILQAFLAEQPRLQGLSEIVSFGGKLLNSETGHSAFRLEPACEIERCHNVLVNGSKWRVVHVGGKQEAGDGDDWMRADTQRADNAATFLKVRDRVGQMFADSTVRETANMIAQGVSEELALPKASQRFQFIENVGRSFDLTEGELALLKDEFGAEIEATGRVSKFSASQALTATAKQLDPDRAFDLQQAGFKVLTSPIGQYLQAIATT